MKVILLQNVAKTGRKYEVKEVSDGYALNYLIPNKLAKIATTSALRELETEKLQQEHSEKKKEKGLIQSIEQLKDSVISISAKINEEGKLFAGIDKGDIINAIKDQKALDVSADNIVLEKPIKDAREHKITIKAGDKKTEFILNIIPRG